MKRWIATCFGLGWLPVAPGTWGSLPPAIVFGVLMSAGVPHIVTVIVMGVMAVVGSASCVCCASAAVAAVGKKDPGEVVMDEFAAQALTFLAIPLLLPRFLSGGESFFFAFLGFLLFRILDIIKPGPIRKLEQLPGGWGVLMDDLAAGAVSAVVLTIAVFLLIHA
jgi:phosphatidylglycerophosphatase A